jgi:hypothetical protein
MDDEWHAVSLAPGTPRANNWDPRANYVFTVKAFGQGSAPSQERYNMMFLDGTRVSFEPSGGTDALIFSTMFRGA